jgi:hypothetical protein
MSILLGSDFRSIPKWVESLVMGRQYSAIVGTILGPAQSSLTAKKSATAEVIRAELRFNFSAVSNPSRVGNTSSRMVEAKSVIDESSSHSETGFGFLGEFRAVHQ